MNSNKHVLFSSIKGQLYATRLRKLEVGMSPGPLDVEEEYVFMWSWIF